LKELL